MWLPSGIETDLSSPEQAKNNCRKMGTTFLTYSALLPIVSGKGSWMQGGMSQNFDLGPSFDFMKCRNLNIKKMKKSYPFFLHKLKTKT